MEIQSMSVFGIKSTSHRDWKVRGTIQSPSLKVQTGCVRPEGNITEVHEMVNSTGRKLFNIQTATTHVGTVRTVTEATVEAAEDGISDRFQMALYTHNLLRPAAGPKGQLMLVY